MKKKKKGARSSQVRPQEELPQKKTGFVRQCSKAVLITASYQIFSLCMDPYGQASPTGPAHNTVRDSASPWISSSSTNPAYVLACCTGGEGVCAAHTGCYDPCTGGCTNCTGGLGPSPAEIQEQQRIQEQERQRQLEAERQRKARLEEERKREEEQAKKRREEFDRNKAEALKSMKGIAEGELGLKDSDAGDLGLKGVGGADGGMGLKDFGDSSVVDLRDKKAPYIVDPNVVKGGTQKPQAHPAPPPPPPAAAQRPATDLVSEFLFPGEPARRATTDDVKEFLFPGEPAGMDDVKEFLFPADAPRSLFPKNPDKPLINPLREPEKWKAFTEAAQKNIEAQARKKRADEVIKKMDEDPGLNKARDRIVREEENAIYNVTGRLRGQATKQFDRLDKRYGVKDFNDYKEKEREDPAYRQKTKAIVDNYWEKVGEAAVKARQGSYKKMSVEVDKFFDKHPELGKGAGQ